MLGDSPLALVALAGQMVVAAADTDGWETAGTVTLSCWAAGTPSRPG